MRVLNNDGHASTYFRSQLGVHTAVIYKSPLPNKKLRVYFSLLPDSEDFVERMKDIHTIDFGSTKYQNYFDKTGLLPNTVNHLDEERRRLYLVRAEKIRDKNGRLTKDNPLSANFWSINILW